VLWALRERLHLGVDLASRVCRGHADIRGQGSDQFVDLAPPFGRGELVCHAANLRGWRTRSKKKSHNTVGPGASKPAILELGEDGVPQRPGVVVELADLTVRGQHPGDRAELARGTL
jgi:hypothetical protein